MGAQPRGDRGVAREMGAQPRGDRGVARERKRVYSCSGMHQQISMEIRKLGGLGGGG